MAQQFLAYSRLGGCSLCDAPSGSGLSITGSVGDGGRNLPGDTRRIQEALNGVTPASDRPIPPLKIDGIVGPKTLAAIRAFQQRRIGSADGRVDPNGPTIRELGRGGPLAPPAKPSAAVAPLPAATDQENKDFIWTIGITLPSVRRWLHTAHRTLDLAIDANSDRPGGGLLGDLGLREYGLVDKYFHIGSLSRPARRAYMQDINKIVRDMQVVVSQSIIGDGLFGYGSGFFQPDPADGTPSSTKYDAYTFFGGWHARNANGKPRMSRQDNYTGANLREDTIFFPVSHYKQSGQDYINLVIVHELAHFVGPGVNSGARIADHSNVHRPDFSKLTSHLAKRTADSYACFIGEAAVGRNPATFR
jgi:peptidoglycan hydrolase-like protein with peptidoglycan-binding domain